MTGSLADAEDLAQETFIQAYRQLPSFRGDSKFSSWLYRIAVNLALNWQKSRARRQQLLDNWASMQETAPTVADPRSHKIQEALLKLNPKQRAAVVLTIYEGLNHAETARVLRCSETTVSWRLFSARAKLKKILGEISHD
jgi:RNA polymerase sigma-70 factor (ECF subfamily)